MFQVRAPVVAGMFYELDVGRLKMQINASYKHALGPKKMKGQSFIAAVVPHAGYDYSGAVAAWVYSRIEEANYIILGPNHTGMGSDFAIMKEGIWKTPLGGVAVHREMAEELMKCELVEYDVMAHRREHSIEVQLPFLQNKFGNDFKFVPISVMNDFADEGLLKSSGIVGKAIAKAVKESKEKWIILASSDFSHYIPQETAMKIDKSLIGAINRMDSELLFSRINKHQASSCGYGAIATAIAAAKRLGAKKGKLLKYSTSGDITGDTNSVVGYAGIIMA